MTDPVIAEILGHIAKLNDEFGQISIDIAVLKERVEMLYKFFWLIVSISIATLLTNFYQIKKMKDNNKK